MCSAGVSKRADSSYARWRRPLLADAGYIIVLAPEVRVQGIVSLDPDGSIERRRILAANRPCSAVYGQDIEESF